MSTALLVAIPLALVSARTFITPLARTEGFQSTALGEQVAHRCGA